MPRTVPSGRTTKALLWCEGEQSFAWHKFAREEPRGPKTIALIFACQCGKERTWGVQDGR